MTIAETQGFSRQHGQDPDSFGCDVSGMWLIFHSLTRPVHLLALPSC